LKKLIITALVCLSVVGVVAGSSVAASSPKATGDIWFNNTAVGAAVGSDNVPAHWVFNAIGGSTVKGNVSYSDPYGSYVGNVTSLTVNGSNATFTAVVTSSTNPWATAGKTYSWTVHDVAEPGIGKDYFSYNDLSNGNSGDLPAITAGNIQVQS
jgi:hypothetical protein